MRKYLTSLLILFSFSLVAAQERSIDEKVDSLLQRMTLDEKIGQMTQAERGALEKESDIAYYYLGSLLSGGGSAPPTNTPEEWAKMYDRYQQQAMNTRLQIPLIYGIDAVHGHNNVKGAVIMPHNIGLGCTFNPLLVAQANQVTAYEVAATGIDWTFSPCIAVPKNEQWGRTYEGFGETPELQKMMAVASVSGLQGDDLMLPQTILACAKHYVGDGGTTDGIDQGNTEVTEEVLRQEHLAGYIDAIQEGVGSIMASYSSWNGQKLHGHDYLLTTVLKGELGFEGFVVSDWKGVDQIDEDYREAVKRAINAGIDMVMVPDRYIYFISILKDLVENNEVSMARIDDAVARILKQKFLLNLFEDPYSDMSLLPAVGSAAHREVARQAVRESLVLLAAKRDVLPVPASGKKILVAGRLANDLGAQCGGWTISWQGSNGDITTGTTILEAIKSRAGEANVIYAEDGSSPETVDLAVMVIGEDPYAEGAGDRTSLALDQEDVALAAELKKRGVPVIVILISGRPMIIGDILPNTDALIAAWLPGTEGQGVADILFGDYNPVGKLSHSWPRNMTQVPINIEDEAYAPLYPYKHGLSDFPSGATPFAPYAASVNDDGTKIILDLNDYVDELTVGPDDFTVHLDKAVTGGVTEVVLSPTDPSRLEISLTEPVAAEYNEVTLDFKGIGILANSMPLVVFEDFYVHNASVSQGQPLVVPGRVEAEDYFAMSGIALEETSDLGGGHNVGWIENGDWMDYYIDVATTGKYDLTGRIAGYNNGYLTFSFAENNKVSLAYQSTNGWQVWRDFNTTVELQEGLQTFRVRANADGFNINYFEFEFGGPVLSTIEPINQRINVYPNPASKAITIELNTMMSGLLKIGLFDLTGHRVMEMFDGITSGSTFIQSFEIPSSVKNGTYILEIKNNGQRHFNKIILSK